ncbi:class I SAM-dependent methyltransferase [Bacillus sp. JJ1122]|uniref:class I SAM-dependent methyltransferase n=1 Tax=Bacillus sp. JJ1122 TaxID=3122951 RepID=UPI0030002E9E
MSMTPVETLFTAFNTTADILKEELACTYLEALAETGENMFQGTVLQDELNEVAKKRLEKTYKEIKLDDFSKEDIRKGFQLAILKGMKEHVQPNHQMTPDSVGMFIGYLVSKFIDKKVFTMLDPAIGTGNLLATVLNQQTDKTVDSIGVEIDDLLIRLAFVNANLQKHSVELFNQDSLEPLFVDPADAVICDLPVGYYPNDLRAEDYEVKAAEGHTYSHHMFIEQSTKHVKAGGYLFFMIPNGLFESEQAPLLHEFIKKNLIVQGILQLPASLFKNKQAAKSILILQKNGSEVKAPKQALLAELPKLSDGAAVNRMLNKIDLWFKENKQNEE